MSNRVLIKCDTGLVQDCIIEVDGKPLDCVSEVRIIAVAGEGVVRATLEVDLPTFSIAPDEVCVKPDKATLNRLAGMTPEMLRYLATYIKVIADLKGGGLGAPDEQ